MTPAQRERSQEWVQVFGPVDTAPGKKMIYKVRPMQRGLAESEGCKVLGIQIVPQGAKSVTVSHGAHVAITMEDGSQMDPRDQMLADLQEQVRQLMEASQKKKPGRKPKVKADAEA